MQKIRCLIALLIFCGLMFSQVWAHDYWILPATFHPAENTILEVAFTSGHGYFEPAGTHRKQKNPKSLSEFGVSVVIGLCGIIVWRRERDSNPRTRFPQLLA